MQIYAKLSGLIRNCPIGLQQASVLLSTFFLIADDFSRVRLVSMNEEEGSDYINANYIPVSDLDLDQLKQ